MNRYPDPTGPVLCGRPCRDGRPCQRPLVWWQQACTHHTTPAEQRFEYRRLTGHD